MNFYFFIFVVLICILAFTKRFCVKLSFSITDKAAKWLDDKRVFIGVAVLLLLLAMAFRLYQYPNYPLGFNQDGAMASVDAKALADYGTDRFGMRFPIYFQAWGYASMGVLYSYISIPFIKIFGLSALTARIPMMIVSVIAIYVIFSLVRKIWGDKPALVVLAFLAINPWHYMQSRWALEANLLPHFLLFAVFLLYKGIFEKKIYLYISMILFALTMYTYGIAFFTIPLFLLILCIYLLVKKEINFKQAFICLGCYLAFAWPVFVMMFLNWAEIPSIELPFLTIPSYYETNARMSDILFFSEGMYDHLIENFNYFTNIVLFQAKDLPWNTIADYGTMYLYSLPFVITGLIFTVRRAFKETNKKRQIGNMMIACWGLVAFISGLIINTVNVNRINIVFYPLILFAGIGIYEIVHRIRPALIVIVLMFSLSFSSFLGSYFGEKGEELGYYFYYGFGEAIQSLDDNDYDTVYITESVPSGESQVVTQILTMFYLGIDSKYYRGEKEIEDNDGNVLLPYAERYQYVSFAGFQIDPEEKNVVYVFRDNEAEFFDPDKFEIKTFGSYGAAVPKT